MVVFCKLCKILIMQKPFFMHKKYNNTSKMPLKALNVALFTCYNLWSGRGSSKRWPKKILSMQKFLYFSLDLKIVEKTSFKRIFAKKLKYFWVNLQTFILNSRICLKTINLQICEFHVFCKIYIFGFLCETWTLVSLLT